MVRFGIGLLAAVSAAFCVKALIIDTDDPLSWAIATVVILPDIAVLYIVVRWTRQPLRGRKYRAEKEL
jgi:hypothetical protein